MSALGCTVSLKVPGNFDLSWQRLMKEEKAIYSIFFPGIELKI